MNKVDILKVGIYITLARENREKRRLYILCTFLILIII